MILAVLRSTQKRPRNEDRRKSTKMSTIKELEALQSVYAQAAEKARVIIADCERKEAARLLMIEELNALLVSVDMAPVEVGAEVARAAPVRDARGHFVKEPAAN